jgi:hypothetical protein
MTRTLRILLLLLVGALILGPTQGAVAHDALVGTDPADGSTVRTAPEALTLTFTGEIATVGAQVVVRAAGAAGQDLVDGPPEVAGAEVVQPLTALGPGDYEVLWRVTSQDGHPISGELAFTVAGAAGATGTATSAAVQDKGTAEVTPAEVTPAVAPADSDGDGIPAWAWLALGIAVLGLLVLLGTAWGRRPR